MTTRARIFRRRQSATQSGRANSDDWVLEWEKTERKLADPIMGHGQPVGQIELLFDKLVP